jgi:hypothetical protein
MSLHLHLSLDVSKSILHVVLIYLVRDNVSTISSYLIISS